MVLYRATTFQLIAACVLLPLHVSKTICLYVLMACAKFARLAPAELLHVALFWGLTGGGGWPLVHGCLAVVNFEVLGPWRVMLKVLRNNGETVVVHTFAPYNIPQFLGLVCLVALSQSTLGAQISFSAINGMLSGHRRVFLYPHQEDIIYIQMMAAAAAAGGGGAHAGGGGARAGGGGARAAAPPPVAVVAPAAHIVGPPTP